MTPMTSKRVARKQGPKTLPIFFVISLIVVAFLAGVFFGFNSQPEIDKVGGVAGKEEGMPEDVDFSAFWETWNRLNEKFVPTSTSTTDIASDQEKVWAAIQGLTSVYDDPYTVFLPPREKEIFESDIKGNFSGVGMEIGIRDNTLTVIAPLKNTPAYRAGLQPGDKILKINDTLTSGTTIDEAVSQIRGEQGTAVNLTILRGTEEPFDVSIVRDVINIPTLETLTHEANGEEIFVIRLFNFSAPSPQKFKEALIEFADTTENGKLILDLRGNPGGFLEAAVDMASWFLPEGKVVVREYFGEDKPEKTHRSKGYDVFTDSLQMVILVDGGSASASEILAGALREHEVATLVGSKTFGKGSVQELVDIKNDSSLKVTIARWLTPEGVSISKNGLDPDVVVELDPELFGSGVDSQFEKAVEILLNNETLSVRRENFHESILP